MTTPCVIVGTGLAGYTLAREIRKRDTDREIIMVTADDGTSYSKPMLSTGFAKGKDAAALAQANAAEMAEQLGVIIRTHTRVQALDIRTRTLTLDNGEQIAAGQVVLATGASPIHLPVEAQAPERVFHVNNLMDYQRFRAALPEGGRVLIMGAGLIGCEFANDLLAGGFEVSVVAPCQAPLPGLLPEPAGEALGNALASAGVTFYLPRVVSALESTEQGVRAILDDGQTLEADRVLSAVGLRPELALARTAGLNVRHGIVVDQWLQTSAFGIYALGDAAEISGQVRLFVQPLMTAARALANTLCGEPAAVAFGPMPVVVKTPSCPVVVCPPDTSAGEWTVQVGEGTDRICRFEDDQGRLRGYALVGSGAVSEKLALTRALATV